RSLGDEVFSYGDGGGSSWLLEHFDQNYIPGWYVPELNDATLITNGISRWHNYYVEGLNWLAKNVGIDGLYIDDVAFDRTTMKRVRKVLDRNRPGALIDLHSANQYNPRDGYVNSALLYMEHFPYINRLWFGEYFDYDSRPDYWLTEISGIPFGLMGEMLEKGGNPWRGMVYGMTNRLPWSGDPRPLWKFWDEFGMQGTKMFGYWSPNCPVKTDNPAVLATVYVKAGKTLVSLASWASDTVQCSLSINWNNLGIDSTKATIEAPAIQNFQEARVFKVGENIPVTPGRGWLLEIN
ncbi:MAG TPA: glycoside hydrolase domain-containing protein, partial [Terriglobia bacterium]|nr:glycoside hydrolase domain-containing protein [Terriglobia bacterium]